MPKHSNTLDETTNIEVHRKARYVENLRFFRKRTEFASLLGINYQDCCQKMTLKNRFNKMEQKLIEKLYESCME